ncbi:MAG: ATP-binding cassette domain-containing protein, partial [Anaerolineales bacterium]
MTIEKALLQVQDISLRFGGTQALTGVSFGVQPGDIVAIIGPNGAGKTSLLNSLNGFYRPYEGQIYFRDQDLTSLAP